MKTVQDPVVNQEGFDTHPAFGVCRIRRVTANPGKTLFQSDLLHREYIQVTVYEAVRKRELSSDWVHSTKVLMEFSVSLAQFASLIASAGTEGVPVTLDWRNGDLPELPHEPRLQESAKEVRAAADKAFAGIQEAEKAYEEALERKAPAAERRKLLSDLRSAIGNASDNVEYAGRKLAEHAEDVVERSRADVEAMVSSYEQLGMALRTRAEAKMLLDREVIEP